MRAGEVLAGAYSRSRGEVEAASPLELATILTTLLVAFHGFDAWFVQLPAQCLVILGLIFRPLLFNPYFWLIMAGFTGWRIVDLWHDVDNHKFILFYWLCCMTLAHAVHDQALKQRVVAFNSRFFLVFIMLGAVAQKLASQSYLDASFFELELLVDTRFRKFVALFGVEPSIFLQSREFFEFLKHPFIETKNNEIFLPSTPIVSYLALFITWYDLIIQAIIGLAFLLCRKSGDFLGHIFLLTFIFTAYFAAPVIGFAWTLVIFGIVLAKDWFPNIALVYILALVVTTLYKIPWGNWLI